MAGIGAALAALLGMIIALFVCGSKQNTKIDNNFKKLAELEGTLKTLKDKAKVNGVEIADIETTNTANTASVAELNSKVAVLQSE